jgi:hypothetical protein
VKELNGLDVLQDGGQPLGRVLEGMDGVAKNAGVEQRL